MRTLQQGKPGTAMKSFSAQLSDDDIEIVADFVAEEFVRCRAENTRYHTAENGWPDHEARYGEAFPFVLGEIPPTVEATELTPSLERGRRLYKEGCISCHEPAAAQIANASITRTASQNGRDGEHDQLEYGAPSEHDEPPAIADLSTAERRGEALYQRDCAYCHAADGTGRNWIGNFLRPHPTDFTDPETAKVMTEDRLRQSTLEGVKNTSMPAFRSVLTADDIDAVVAYIRRAFFRK